MYVTKAGVDEAILANNKLTCKSLDVNINFSKRGDSNMAADEFCTVGPYYTNGDWKIESRPDNFVCLFIPK